MNEISQEKRLEYWEYLTSEKVERPKGVTDKRLTRVKEDILAFDYFWFQVISRFGADHMTAIEFYKEERRYRSVQSRAQFWSLVREKTIP